MHISFLTSCTPPPLPLAIAPQLRLDGLLGGHSGLNIHEDRGNAVQLLARTLLALGSSAPGLRVASVRGGDKRNAIAREAQALVMVRLQWLGGRRSAEVISMGATGNTVFDLIGQEVLALCALEALSGL